MKKTMQYNTKHLYFSDQLIKAMEGIFQYPLTIVEAPIGYGKTTAVRECLSKEAANVLWQKIYDNNESNFWNGFCRLIRDIDVECAERLINLGFPNDMLSILEALNLLKEIVFDETMVWVIDDYHLLESNEADNFIKFLVMEEVENLHIVLTARYINLMGAEELMLKGYLYHIPKDIFAFAVGSIQKYYKLCGISLKDSDASTLYSYTEGWISALYLIMMNYKKVGKYETNENITKLIEKAIYEPFSDEIKEFLLQISMFKDFTLEQATFMWKKDNTFTILEEIINCNALVNYNARAKTYQIHNMFHDFCIRIFENQEAGYKQKVHHKIAQWYLKNAEYDEALHYFYISGDYDNLLTVIEIDKFSNFSNEDKERMIQYFKDCPEDIRHQHPVAILIYAMHLMTLNELELFQKACAEFEILIHNCNLDSDSINGLMGEYELLLSFTKYNDIMGMCEHHKKACALMKGPTAFMNTKASWTFGAPSVLYMFYKESGKLENEVQEMLNAMPYYYQLTNNHGMGAEYVMEAERYFNEGDFENAEIIVYKALYAAKSAIQPNIVICAQFLQVRLALMRGDYMATHNLFVQMREVMEKQKYYYVIHTIDLCEAYLYCCLGQKEKIHSWIANGEFQSSRLFFPAMAFMNIIYGKAILMNGEYPKLLGIAQQFIGIASVFPNQLGLIYTYIYMAAANERLYRHEEALAILKTALDIALPDKVYIPFVENNDYIMSMLNELASQNNYRSGIAQILKLCMPYQKSRDAIIKTLFTVNTPELTEREIEIAKLAAEGVSNKNISEKLFVTQNTVKTVLKRVFQKLDINSRSLLKQYFDEKLNIH